MEVVKTSLDRARSIGIDFTWKFWVKLVLAGTEPKLLRISPDLPLGRCDGGTRNSTLRFHFMSIYKLHIYTKSYLVSHPCGSENFYFLLE